MGHMDILTGVDKLVALVNRKGKISLNQAAKELGVSKQVVEEWGHFLADRQILEMKYFLTNVYLIKKELSKEELRRKEREVSIKKDVVVRKAENFLNEMQLKYSELESLKENYMSFKKKIEVLLEELGKHFDELEEFHRIKREIERGISPQKAVIDDKLQDIDRELKKFEDEYIKIKTRTEAEEKRIEEKEKASERVLRKESDIYEKLERLEERIRELKKVVMKEAKEMDNEESELKRIERKAQLLKSQMLDKRSEFLRIIKEIEAYEDKIKDRYRKIEKDVTEFKGLSRKEINKIKRDFKEAKSKIKKIDELITDALNEYHSIVNELVRVTNEAKSISALKGNPTKSEIQPLNEKLKQLKKEKDKFERKLKKLNLMLKE